MTSFTPQTGTGSPDRLDALVWAMTVLMEPASPRFIPA